MVRKKTPSALYHSPAEYAQDLIDAWSQHSCIFISLSSYVQEVLSSQKTHCVLGLSASLLKKDKEKGVPITKVDFRHALACDTTTTQGVDGITYSALCLLKVPGDPHLQLYNMYLKWVCTARVENKFHCTCF